MLGLPSVRCWARWLLCRHGRKPAAGEQSRWPDAPDPRAPERLDAPYADAGKVAAGEVDTGKVDTGELAGGDDDTDVTWWWADGPRRASNGPVADVAWLTQERPAQTDTTPQPPAALALVSLAVVARAREAHPGLAGAKCGGLGLPASLRRIVRAVAFGVVDPGALEALDAERAIVDAIRAPQAHAES